MNILKENYNGNYLLNLENILLDPFTNEVLKTKYKAIKPITNGAIIAPHGCVEYALAISPPSEPREFGK